MNAIESGRNEWKYYSRAPLNEATEAVKCNYVIYWSGDHGMDLVDKWTTKGKVTEENKETLNTYWTKFEEYIHPQTNKLIAVVELKWTISRYYEFRGLSHTKAMRLVTQAGYEGGHYRSSIQGYYH